MRASWTALLLMTLASAGCLGGGGFSESEGTDAFGNVYDVEDHVGNAPDDGGVVVGASARDLLVTADTLAAEWDEEARLLMVATVESTDGTDDSNVFIGPRPSLYTQHDRFIGDGLAPQWSYLYASDDEAVDDCEYLFVHVASNGFAVSYTFDPEASTFELDGRDDHWRCGDAALTGAAADWTLDSNDASSIFSQADERFNKVTDEVTGVIWYLDVHPGVDVQKNRDFGTTWFVLATSDLKTPLAPDVFLLCQAAAGSEPFETDCYNDNGINTKELGANNKQTPPLAAESGSGEIEFGFVFSGPQTDTFSFDKDAHPALVVNITLASDSVYETVTVELLDPSTQVVDSFDAERTQEEQSRTLTAATPDAGEWTIRVSGNAGTPSVDYRWCAQGYDYDNEAVIDCA